MESGSLDPLVSPLFSARMNMAKAAAEWCKERNIPLVAHNIVTALFALKLVKRTNVRSEPPKEAQGGNEC